MSKSARLKQLEKRVLQLKNHLLPAIKTSGNYTKKEQDLTKSFRLLVHAEIEAYFEDRALHIAEKAINEWKFSRKVTKPLFTMAILVLNEEKLKRDASTRINSTYNCYKQVVKKNNGIKGDDLKKILLPIGLIDTDFDNTWLNTVDSWAKLRGEVAHTHFKTHQQIDPQTELTTVQLILGGIESLDLTITSTIK